MKQKKDEVRVIKLSDDEYDQVQNHLVQIESKIDRALTVLWYLEEEAVECQCNLKIQHMNEILVDYMNLAKKDIDSFYKMYAVEEEDNENEVKAHKYGLKDTPA